MRVQCKFLLKLVGKHEYVIATHTEGKFIELTYTNTNIGMKYNKTIIIIEYDAIRHNNIYVWNTFNSHIGI